MLTRGPAPPLARPAVDACSEFHAIPAPSYLFSFLSGACSIPLVSHLKEIGKKNALLTGAASGLNDSRNSPIFSSIHTSHSYATFFLGVMVGRQYHLFWDGVRKRRLWMIVMWEFWEVFLFILRTEICTIKLDDP